ncbi:Na+/H+ antiporter [Kocuria sp. cx-116]|uniref:Na+/H+ antiporter n=1 Tax=Kocuria sp. cx-116 TaxID=2771378 RepID=UPI0016829081|nr:Na+/H+ antiporter [Kocuria sp. cx-116]MBD2763122.1 Na+/H+ antiporter [Kocuria sp. cx-116]
MMFVEIALVSGLVLLLGSLLAKRFGLIEPVVLVLAGVVAALLLPTMRNLQLPSELVLSILLPLLLFWEAANISQREIRKVLRGVIINATLLVLVTAVSVGFVGQWLGLGLGTALLIGAAVAPTDATAVAAMGRGVDRQTMTQLRAESLINDGTALVVFALALEFASGDNEITVGHASGFFAISFIGGILAGLAVGWVTSRIISVSEDAIRNNVYTLLAPLAGYFLAETVEASGVLAAVVAGLFLAQAGPRRYNAASRSLFFPFWGMTTYLINGTLFVFVGVELPAIIAGLPGADVWRAVGATFGIYVTMILVRFVFGEVAIQLTRLLDRRPTQRLRRTTLRQRVVNSVAGFRGAVSLAVALSIPTTLDDAAFPGRDMAVFTTSGVVLLSLVVQGLLMPVVVRWFNAKPGPNVEPEGTDEREELEALVKTAQAAVEALPTLAQEQGASEKAMERVRSEYRMNATAWASELAEELDTKSHAVVSFRADEHTLRVAVAQVSRRQLIDMRDRGDINDEALTRLLRRIDLEELRITGPVEME